MLHTPLDAFISRYELLLFFAFSILYSGHPRLYLVLLFLVQVFHHLVLQPCLLDRSLESCELFLFGAEGLVLPGSELLVRTAFIVVLHL